MSGAPRAVPMPGGRQGELSVPVHKDAQSFDERQKSIWEEMHDQMERRRLEWEHDVSTGGMGN